MKILPLLEDYEVEYDNEGNPLSPEQSKFFINSKIRDRKDRLLVCYHGTDAEFDIFSKGDIGFHFGTEGSAKERRDYKGNPDKWNINKFYLNIKNPLTFEYDVGDWYGNNIISHIIESRIIELEDDEIRKLQQMGYGSKVSSEESTRFIKKFLKEKGFDGIRYVNAYEDADSWSYIAFYPNQIKSIYNKNPSNSDNINEEKELNEVYPNKGESKEDFISRFMSVTKDEYPDVKQRYAIALSYWDRRNKKK